MECKMEMINSEEYCFYVYSSVYSDWIPVMTTKAVDFFDASLAFNRKFSKEISKTYKENPHCYPVNPPALIKEEN